MLPTGEKGQIKRKKKEDLWVIAEFMHASGDLLCGVKSLIQKFH